MGTKTPEKRQMILSVPDKTTQHKRTTEECGSLLRQRQNHCCLEQKILFLSLSLRSANKNDHLHHYKWPICEMHRANTYRKSLIIFLMFKDFTPHRQTPWLCTEHYSAGRVALLWLFKCCCLSLQPQRIVKTQSVALSRTMQMYYGESSTLQFRQSLIEMLFSQQW